MSYHTLSYDGVEIAHVFVKHESPATLAAIREMVQFWALWDRRLATHNGDYIQCWLHQLGRFMMRHGRPPNGADDEGWCRLDGTLGLRVLRFEAWDHDEGLLEVTTEEKV